MFKSQLNLFKCIFTLWVQRYGFSLKKQRKVAIILISFLTMTE